MFFRRQQRQQEQRNQPKATGECDGVTLQQIQHPGAKRAQALSVLYSHFVTSVHTLYVVTVVTVVPVVVKKQTNNCFSVVVKRKTATCREHEKA